MTSHTEAIDARDIANLDQLRDLFAHADPVPSDLAERMKFAITVHALHAEVAELMDSALLTTRGADSQVEPRPPDSVTFKAASVGLMVSASPSEQHDTDARVRVDGWIRPPAALVEAATTER